MAWRDYLPWTRGDRRATATELMSVGQPTLTSARPVVRISANDHEGDEYGVTGTENFGGYIRREDFNPELDDFQRAVVIFEKMRRTDSQIRAMLQVIKLPLRGATWTAIPPPGGDPVDQQIADFVNAALFDDDAMLTSWDYVLRHLLMQLDFGFSVLEKVWRVDEDGFYKLKKLAPRLPKTIREWHTHRDGRLRAVVQYAPVPFATESPRQGAQRTSTYHTSVSYQYLTIPAEVLVVSSFEREGDNYEGWSILRTVYRNWWFKDQAYHIEGVGLDRFGVGIPVAELEDGHNLNTGDLETLREVLKAIRSNERAYLVAPPHVKFRILPDGGTAGAAGERAVRWIEHHDQQIARNVLAGFLTMGTDPHGTLGFGSRLTDMFVSSLNGVAKGIGGDLKHQVVKELCTLNFDMTRRQLPSVVAQDLENVDLSNIIEAMAKLANVTITPTDDDESLMRKMMNLPPLDPAFSRKKKLEDAKATAAKQLQQGQQPPQVDNNGNALDPKDATGGTGGVPGEGQPPAPEGKPVVEVRVNKEK